MQTSRFQLGLVAALSVGLGLCLSSSQAIGYPSGPAVSYGANPVWAAGGMIDSGAAAYVTAPADQDLVVTDILISTQSSSERVNLTLEDGTDVGKQMIHSYGGSRPATPMQHSFSSGIRIPAGTYLQLNGSYGAELNYLFSGYYAKP